MDSYNEYLLKFWKQEELKEKRNFRHQTREELLTQIHKCSKSKAGLIKRTMKPLLESKPAQKDGFLFRVMQWNILAQGLTENSFIKCPPDALSWDFRKLLILQEILEVNPDVLCLEEVDHFGYFKAAFDSVGYEGHFFPKPDSPALSAPDNNGPDGCALFFKKNKLSLINYDTVILETLQGSATNQVSICSTFRPCTAANDKSDFCVAVFHFKSKTGYEKLRQEQGQYLLKYLRKFAAGKPVLLAGDMNAECTESVYDAMSLSDLNVDSAYKNLSKEMKEPSYTTWKIRGTTENPKEFCRCIDYIWHNTNRMQVVGLLELPAEDAIGPDRLPSYSYPSDHLSLCADLLLAPQT